MTQARPLTLKEISDVLEKLSQLHQTKLSATFDKNSDAFHISKHGESVEFRSSLSHYAAYGDYAKSQLEDDINDSFFDSDWLEKSQRVEESPLFMPMYEMIKSSN